MHIHGVLYKKINYYFVIIFYIKLFKIVPTSDKNIFLVDFIDIRYN